MWSLPSRFTSRRHKLTIPRTEAPPTKTICQEGKQGLFVNTFGTVYPVPSFWEPSSHRVLMESAVSEADLVYAEPNSFLVIFQNKLAKSVHLSLVGAPTWEAKLGAAGSPVRERGWSPDRDDEANTCRETDKEKNSEHYSNPGSNCLISSAETIRFHGLTSTSSKQDMSTFQIVPLLT